MVALFCNTFTFTHLANAIPRVTALSKWLPACSIFASESMIPQHDSEDIGHHYSLSNFHKKQQQQKRQLCRSLSSGSLTTSVMFTVLQLYQTLCVCFHWAMGFFDEGRSISAYAPFITHGLSSWWQLLGRGCATLLDEVQEAKPIQT